MFPSPRLPVALPRPDAPQQALVAQKQAFHVQQQAQLAHQQAQAQQQAFQAPLMGQQAHYLGQQAPLVFHRAGIDLSDLDAPFSEEEAWLTIKSLPADRAPAYITLIPKKLEALEAKDYRPISLVHSFAKLVTKMMANRLAPHLDKLVATNQSAFTRGRCIHDNFMLVQQTIKVLHRRKISSLFLKLDISSQKLLIQLIGLFYWKFCHTWGLALFGEISSLIYFSQHLPK